MSQKFLKPFVFPACAYNNETNFLHTVTSWTEPDGEVLVVRKPPIRDAEHKRRFIPPSADTRPSDIFSVQYNRCTVQAPRFIANDDRGTILIFIDGACSGNGQVNARAAYGVVFRTSGNVAQRLELPDGFEPTSNRAELRAAICALQMRSWNGEGFDRIVLATDSSYVASSACNDLPKWRRKGWRTKSRMPIIHHDLWEILLQEIVNYENIGVSVQFWRIPRGWNEADALAKRGAKSGWVPRVFTETLALDV